MNDESQKSNAKTEMSKCQIGVRIGVLDIQGSVEEHAMMLEKRGVEVVFVKTVRDLEGVRGLIIPGGESTHISMMMKSGGLFDAIKNRIKNGMAVYGTCAGAILLAKKIIGDTGSKKVKNLGVLDMEIERNAYGRQVDSFEVDIKARVFGARPFPAVFIRAPRIKHVGRNVEVLAEYNGEIVMARGSLNSTDTQKNILVSTFHPELTDDTRVHEYFIKMAK